MCPFYNPIPNWWLFHKFPSDKTSSAHHYMMPIAMCFEITKCAVIWPLLMFKQDRNINCMQNIVSSALNTCSVHPPFCTSAHLSMCPSTHLSIYPSRRPSAHLSMHSSHLGFEMITFKTVIDLWEITCTNWVYIVSVFLKKC